MTESIPTTDSHRTRQRANDLIAASGLPEEARALIGNVVGRTRLWRREKAQVAMELIAHFQDGLAAGRTPQDLVATFGDSKTAARLIRRAKKRNRPLLWHVGRRLQQAIVLFILAYLIAIPLLLLRQPRVTVDYIAKLNQPIQAIPQEDRAWPIYRKAWIEGRIWDIQFDQVQVRDAEGNLGRYIRPGDPQWPQMAVFLDKHRLVLEAARSGGLKPALGLPAVLPRDYSQEDLQALSLIEPTASVRSANEPDTRDLVSRLVYDSCRSVVLPVPHMRTMGVLLDLDMRYAASVRDAGRVWADYRALLGLAQQAREVRTLSNQLTAIAMLDWGDLTFAKIHSADPSLLASHRVAILHAMAAAEACFSLDWSGQKMMLLDSIQRTYSDNGNGDGSMTNAGILFMRASSYWRPATTRPANRSIPATALGDGGLASLLSPDQVLLLTPAAAALCASRRELTNKAHIYYAAADQEARQPYWQRLRSTSTTDQLREQWLSSEVQRARLLVLGMLLPNVSVPAARADNAKALHEATMVGLSLEAYRQKQGHYPASLAELVPQYLPKLPLDHSTGGPLRYKLKDGRPLLYGLGRDGRDNGGAWTADPSFPPPYTGDWVLYPPVEPY